VGSEPEDAARPQQAGRDGDVRPRPTAQADRAEREVRPDYAGGCVPPYPPDVDCADIRALGIAPVRVIGVDVHRLDGDDDGLGCE
jgi:hypothetical protein